MTTTQISSPVVTSTQSQPRTNRRTVVALLLGGLLVAAAALTITVVQRLSVEAPAAAASTTSVTVGEAAHGGPGSRVDSTGSLIPSVGTAVTLTKAAEGPVAHGGAGTVSIGSSLRLYRAELVVPVRTAPAQSPQPSGTRLEHLTSITAL